MIICSRLKLIRFIYINLSNHMLHCPQMKTYLKGIAIFMAKGNDGNYLQHSIEVNAAMHLSQMDTNGRLHIALTHGMAPFERFEKSDQSQTDRKFLVKALKRFQPTFAT